MLLVLPDSSEGEEDRELGEEFLADTSGLLRPRERDQQREVPSDLFGCQRPNAFNREPEGV
jgi:hypothetical protein